MKRGRLLLLMVWSGIATVGTVWAQDAPPTENKSVPSNFRSYIVVDNRYPPKKTPVKRPEDRDPRDRTDKLHDLVVELGLNPVLAVFTRSAPAPDSPTAKLIKDLDAQYKDMDKAALLKANNFGSFVVFLRLAKEYPFDARYVGGNPKEGFVREAEAEAIRAFAGQLAAPHTPLALAAGDSEQAKAWGITEETETAIVLYNRMKVIARWNFPTGTPPTDEEIQKIVAAAVKEGIGS